MITVKLLGPIKKLMGKNELQLLESKLYIDEIFEYINKVTRTHNLSYNIKNTVVILNDVEISMIDVKKTIVKSGDDIILIPAIHGGNVII